ncbi:helix-turn-helix domain-containing protein [Cytobacillus purgationiresistens]|uniref:Transcriptional regulator with XRE-family HTH domain n=1 Tax=Cytobacillus purgationiresistens TaxID=863449 RepID=A0ABU0AD82_9BACI|nr:helix-turn-helix domain-containing protein [Cytobacillus purgationiresistens]MDQ0269215.1 transcriptional regulator with XRE-family HTH domain [Cytobacillus purgationiresistens]
MDFSAIGRKIKELRKGAGLSQTDLARGICTQAQVSKIENGDVIPFASTLYFISQRLGLDVDYFFDVSMSPRMDYVREVSSLLKTARKNINYTLVQEIVEAEEKNPLFTANKHHYQLLIWHKAISTYHHDRDFDKAIQFIDQAIGMTFDKIWTEREIEIYLSKGIFHAEEKRYTEAWEIYQAAHTQLNNLFYLKDSTIRTRLHYNSAKTLTHLEEYERSISSCQDAIQACLQNDDLYLLGELYYQIGFNYEMQRQYDEAILFLEKALFIFIMQESQYIDFVKEKIVKNKSQIMS